MVTRQSVKGNKNRFPKPNIINSVLHPSWFKTSTNCKSGSDTSEVLQSRWLSGQGAEPEGGKDWGWRCSFPPNNHPGAKQTFLRQTNRLKQQRSCHSITTPGQNLLCFYCPGFSIQLFMYFPCHPKSPPLLQPFYCVPVSRRTLSFMCKTH